VHGASPWLCVDRHTREGETGGGCGVRTTTVPRVLTARERARAGRHAPLRDAPGSACLSTSWAPPLCRPPAPPPPPELCPASVPIPPPPLPRRGISRVLQKAQAVTSRCSAPTDALHENRSYSSNRASGRPSLLTTRLKAYNRQRGREGPFR